MGPDFAWEVRLQVKMRVGGTEPQGMESWSWESEKNLDCGGATYQMQCFLNLGVWAKEEDWWEVEGNMMQVAQKKEWIAELMTILTQMKKVRSQRHRKYANMYGLTFTIATKPMRGNANDFVKYWAPEVLQVAEARHCTELVESPLKLTHYTWLEPIWFQIYLW